MNPANPFGHLPTFPAGSIEDRMQRIARARWSAPIHDPYSDVHYAALVEECDRQFASLTGCYGVRVEFSYDDPYPDSGSLCADIDGGRMRVWVPDPSGPYHPYLTAEEYGRMRAVHDYFGHYRGRQKERTCHAFAWRGELNAFRAHAETLSPLALSAMAAEVIGTNAEYAYGPWSDKPIGMRPFPAPKSWALPPDYWFPLLDSVSELQRIGSDPDLWRARADWYASGADLVKRWSVRDRQPPAHVGIAFPAAGCEVTV